jgi:AcrR family transcriptional regulator
MPSSRIARQHETRARLLDAAARVVAERGYHAASVDVIAQEAGFTKGAVYANFASKEALLLAVLDRFEDRWVSLYGDLLVAGNADAIAAAAQEHGDDWTGTLLERELWLLAARNPAVRARLADRYRRTRAGLAERLAAKAGHDAPDQEDLDRATLLLALEIGLSSQAFLEPAAVPVGLTARSMAVALGARP